MDFRKKLNYNLFHFNNNGYNDIWAKEESNSLQKSKYATTFYRNASQRKINFAVTPSVLTNRALGNLYDTKQTDYKNVNRHIFR